MDTTLPEMLLALHWQDARLRIRSLPGALHATARVTHPDGQSYFLKYAAGADALPRLRSESEGLDLLESARALRLPGQRALLHLPAKGSGLLMAWIEASHPDRRAWVKLGRGLAALHRISRPVFGAWPDNVIGTLPQSNRDHPDWAAFYARERLWPRLEQGLAQGLLDPSDADALERLCHRLPEICPPEAPALLHGDLWAGNVLFDLEGEPILIDPAVSFGHREMDLAMSRLFGGFDPAFYAAYQEAWPTVADLERRLPVYQLYYLLVHVNLFGRSYVPAVREILRAW
jgi:protein-ribulosamine 3-kinase